MKMPSPALDEVVDPVAEAGPEENPEILPTDIVFNCPHCGHSLCIDCRGAGLITNCTECAREVQVPIPEGMNVGDLDLSSEQMLGRLFHTRRTLSRAEARISELEEIIASLKERRSMMEKSRMSTLHHWADLSNLCQAVQHNQAEVSAALNRMLEIIAAEQQH
jgi:Mg2+ and Co2+ transporter CorA